MRKISFLIIRLSNFVAALTVIMGIAWANETPVAASSKAKLSMKPTADKALVELKPQPKALLSLSPADLSDESSIETRQSQLAPPVSNIEKPSKQFHYVESVKPNKQLSQRVKTQHKPNKIASVKPEPKVLPKSQQVLLAPIVVLPNQGSAHEDVESRLQLKPKKQQVLHPAIVALPDESPKPMLVLQPKVVVAPAYSVSSSSASSSYISSPAPKKTKWIKPNKTASFSNSSQGKTKAKRKIYQYEQAGITTFSNIVPDSVDFEVLLYDCFACQVDSQVDWHSIPLFAFKHTDFVTDAAKQFQLDPALIRAVIHAESAFNAKARSKVGAVGLMQLMPATAKELGVSDAYDIKQNIWGGSQYLAYLLNRFDNDIDLACAAYNAGPTTVTKYQGIPPYPETQAYVERVKILLKRYRAALKS